MQLRFNIIDDLNYYSKNDNGAKECALICVDEILSALNNVVGQDDSLYEEEKHWNKVKKEINKL